MLETAKPRPREMGLTFGTLPAGEINAITDVAGVLVGHVTLDDASVHLHTGVTVILPHLGNIFREKVAAAVHVVNGFGKATGFLQIEELGVLETPIALTNTLSVPMVLEGLIEAALTANADIGRTTGTVNAVVCECNDGLQNDIRARQVKPYHLLQALGEARSGQVAEGNIGAGRGMVCYGYKGGIGTSSRVLPRSAGSFTVGCLALTNFGRPEQLLIAGVPVGAELLRRKVTGHDSSDGSVVVVLATDAPLDARQLGRLARRGGLGLARTGSVAAHGSGDFVIAFSTANRTLHDETKTTVHRELVHESGQIMNLFFQAVVESIEEAVVNSLFAARTTVGLDGKTVLALPVGQVMDIIRLRGGLGNG